MNIPIHLITEHAADITAVRTAHPEATILVAHDTPAFRQIGDSGALTLETFERGFQRQLQTPIENGFQPLRLEHILGRTMFLDHLENVVAFEVHDADLATRGR